MNQEVHEARYKRGKVSSTSAVQEKPQDSAEQKYTAVVQLRCSSAVKVKVKDVIMIEKT